MEVCFMETGKLSTKQIGNAGEERAARYLEKEGYRILRRNYRTRRAELDIIAQKGDIVAVVEVKTLPAGSPEDIGRLIDARKRKRIMGAAQFFLLGNPEYGAFHIRFDVIIIDMPALGPVFHIENAFAEG
jgi:putative endonuclease